MEFYHSPYGEAMAKKRVNAGFPRVDRLGSMLAMRNKALGDVLKVWLYAAGLLARFLTCNPPDLHALET